MAYVYNPTDGLMNGNQFPTNPINETAARQQFQTLFDQSLGFINEVDGKFTNYAHKTNDFTKSLTTNGYQKLPSGLILQWGITSVTPVANTVVTKLITFPTAFTTKLFFITINPNTSVPDIVQCAAKDKDSLTEFDIYLKRTNTTVTEVYWFALGY